MENEPAGKLPELPFGVRLRAARKMAGLSMEGLAGRLGGMVTKQAIGKYEKGLMLPTRAVLEKLVEVLQGERAFGRPGRKVSLGELAAIKTAYGISLQAIMRRARALDLVTERRYRVFREKVKARGWGVTEPVEYAGVERATRFRRLVHRAVASGVLDVERAAAVAGVRPEELRSEIGEIF